MQYVTKLKQRGQVMILYALLIPVLIIALGVGLDLGWYYLNVSRLQNAADAAAVAGAHALIDSDSTKFADYNVKLVAQYPADLPDKTTDISEGNAAAAEYARKNLSTDAKAELQGDDYKMTSSYSRGGDKTIKVTPKLYKDGDDYYYVVSMSEKIHHFFIGFSSLLGGETDDMSAPVVAVALISKNTSDPFMKALEDAKNKNVIIGNWEVQDKYRESSDKNPNKITIKPGEKLIDSSGHYVDEDNDGNPDVNNTGKNITVKLKKSGQFCMTFDSEYYTGAWNHFQDFKNHYYLGDLYRKETVIVKDDVEFVENPNGEDIIDRDGNKGTITSYGAGKYGESSSVTATSASINTDPNNLAYNPRKENTLKTHQTGITERDKVGLPYTWQRLDSINIDFRPEVTLSDKWLSEDWDLECGFDDFITVKNNQFETSGSDANKIRFDYVKRLRIHTSVNFEDPYKVRPDVDTDAEPDVLWARIESEPILNKPDVTDSSNLAGLSSIVSTASLNSVNQIILNFNQSNCNTNDQRYRPVIIFYDGPETYSIYSYYDTINKFVRKSKPVIVNLNASYRGILYAPNSPVVVIGDHKDDFKGFIVAKKYMQLKDDDDFISAEDYLKENMGLEGEELTEAIYTYAYRYFNNANRQYEYTRGEEKADGTVDYIDLGGEKVSGSVKKDTDAYRLKVYYDINEEETDPAKKKRYYKIYGKKAGATTSEIKAAAKSAANTYEIINGMKYIKVIEENGIDMYVNDYGEIQFEDLPNPTKPWKCGVYDNFGRTDFTTYDYHVNETSADNMLLSGK